MLDAVLIGVPKSGSTTLADWLQTHPGVAMARIKEPNFYAAELDPQSFSESFLRVSPDAGPDYWAQPDPLPQRTTPAFGRTRKLASCALKPRRATSGARRLHTLCPRPTPQQRRS
jgi:hypothetical protein